TMGIKFEGGGSFTSSIGAGIKGFKPGYCTPSIVVATSGKKSLKIATPGAPFTGAGFGISVNSNMLPAPPPSAERQITIVSTWGSRLPVTWTKFTAPLFGPVITKIGDAVEIPSVSEPLGGGKGVVKPGGIGS